MKYKNTTFKATALEFTKSPSSDQTCIMLSKTKRESEQRSHRWVALLLLLFYSPMIHAQNYFFDAKNGNDYSDGRSEASAFRTVSKLRSLDLKPGDHVYFKKGQTFNGQLYIKNKSGSKSQPIRIASYGEDNLAKPEISGGGRHPSVDDYRDKKGITHQSDSAIEVINSSHLIIENIKITNTGETPKPGRRGIVLYASGKYIMKDITLKNLTIADINGVFSKEQGGGAGIKWRVANADQSRFDGLTIEGCHLIRCDRNGISGALWPWDLNNLSTNVVIRNNLIEDVGGDAITVTGTEAAIVEYNRVYDARRRVDFSTNAAINEAGPSIGIWDFIAKNTIFRYNEVWDYSGYFDGQGFDSDYVTSGSTFEYNFSGNNAGGFFLIIDKHNDANNKLGNINTTIRNNISLDDHLRAFVIDGPMVNLNILDNIIYNTRNEDIQGIVHLNGVKKNTNGLHSSINIKNNTFYTQGKTSVYHGVWKRSEVGLWSPNRAIDPSILNVSNNSYSSVEGFKKRSHSEKGMRILEGEYSLLDFVKEKSRNDEVSKNYDHLFQFLKKSQRWDAIRRTLSDKK